MPGGFKESPLRLNQGLGSLVYWNEETIRQRAEKLAGQALSVWVAPKLEPAVLEAYKPQAATAGYTIDDHPYLATALMRELFEALRKQVLALDPCVSEEFLKLYIAYKAGTITNCCNRSYGAQKLSIEVMAEEIAAVTRGQVLHNHIVPCPCFLQASVARCHSRHFLCMLAGSIIHTL